MVRFMSYVIAVTPSAREFREAAGLDELPEHVRADLLTLRDEVCARFPEADAVGETGALSVRPEIEGVSVVIRPEVITRPLVANAVMQLAAPLQLTVTSPEQGLVADPRDRIDIDVHRRPTTANACITDHAVRGRPFGTLPWVPRDLLAGLVNTLVVDGDRLELEADSERWFLYERVDGSLVLSVADGPGAAIRSRTVSPEHATLAADAGWAWARCRRRWLDFFAAAEPEAGAVPASDDALDRDSVAPHAVLGDVA